MTDAAGLGEESFIRIYYSSQNLVKLNMVGPRANA